MEEISNSGCLLFSTKEKGVMNSSHFEGDLTLKNGICGTLFPALHATRILGIISVVSVRISGFDLA